MKSFLSGRQGFTQGFGAALVLASLVFMSGSAVAFQIIEGETEYSQKIQSYHLDKNPERALREYSRADISAILDAANDLDMEGEARTKIIAFLVQVLLDASPDAIMSMSDPILSGPDRGGAALFAEALGYTDRPDRDDLINAIALPDGWRSKLLTYKPYDYSKANIVSGLQMDMQWAAFFGSGRGVFIQNIASKLTEISSEQELTALLGTLKPAIDAGDPNAIAEVQSAILSYAAMTTLVMNARESPVVRQRIFEIVEEEPERISSEAIAALAVVLVTTNP